MASTMTREDMERFVEIMESGDPVKDFFDEWQIQQWLLEFVQAALEPPDPDWERDPPD